MLEKCRIAMYANMKSHWSNINANGIFLKEEQKKLLIWQKSKKGNTVAENKEQVKYNIHFNLSVRIDAKRLIY